MIDDVITSLINEVNKKLGAETIRLFNTEPETVEVIPTGIPTLDLALDVGGIPRGRVTEVYGHEAAGKSTICQRVAANAQKQGLLVAYIDMEHAMDLEYARICGVDTDRLLLAQPDSGERALTAAETLVRSEKVGLIVIDSVAALVPQREIDGDMGDAVMGLQARLMSQALRKLSGAIKRTNTAVMFTNQMRQKIGVMFGNPDTTTGGLALKFYSSIRLELRKSTLIKRKDDIIGNLIKAKVVKNKVGKPYTSTEFNIIYGEGVDVEADLLTALVAYGVLASRGSYYYLGDENIAQGKENLRAWLRTQDTEQLLRQVWENKRKHILPIEPPQAKKGSGDESPDDVDFENLPLDEDV